jgi:cytochrome c-type biogenesis protein
VETAATALWIGLLAATSPCVLPLYPGYLAYLGGRTGPAPGSTRRLLGPAILAGVLAMMLTIGGIVTGLTMAIGRALTILVPLAIGVILVMGIAMLAGRNPLRRLPGLTIRGTSRPLLDAFLYGLVFGPIVMPCCGPLVIAIFALSTTVVEALSSLWVFLWFGIGLGAPLLVLSFLPGRLQLQVTAASARHGRAIEVIGGVLLIGAAVYYAVEDWDLFRLYVR